MANWCNTTPAPARFAALLFGFASLLLGGEARTQYQPQDMNNEEFQRFAAYNFRAIPDEVPGADNDTPQRVALGEALYHDTNLSKNRNISCASCHPVKNGGAGMDGLPTSPGTAGEFGSRNTPTVLNSAFHRVLFWDGRANSLEEQAIEPLLNPIEMGLQSEEQLLARVRENARYPALFAAAFQGQAEPLTVANIVLSIGAFERSLVSRSRYDEYASGNIDALNAQEVRGLKTFVVHDCKECHGGVFFGGNNSDRLGIKHPFPDQEDLGQFLISGLESEKMRFKVASLRNVGLTAPYFHNGKVKTLEEAVRLMGWHQKGVRLSDEEVADIVAFLHSLSDQSRVK